LGEAQAGGQKGRGSRRILRQQKGKAENFSSLKEKIKRKGRVQK